MSKTLYVLVCASLMAPVLALADPGCSDIGKLRTCTGPDGTTYVVIEGHVVSGGNPDGTAWVAEDTEPYRTPAERAALRARMPEAVSVEWISGHVYRLRDKAGRSKLCQAPPNGSITCY